MQINPFIDRGDSVNDYFEPSSAHFRHRLQ